MTVNPDDVDVYIG